MTLPASGTLTFSQIQTEHGGSNPISLNEYYRQGSIVPFNPTTGSVPTSGTIAVSDFYSTEGFEGSFFEFTSGNSGGKDPSTGVKAASSGAFGTWIRTSFAGSVDGTAFTTTMIQVATDPSLGFHPIRYSRRAPNTATSSSFNSSGPATNATITIRTGSSTGPIHSNKTMSIIIDGTSNANAWYDGDYSFGVINNQSSFTDGTTYFGNISG